VEHRLSSPQLGLGEREALGGSNADGAVVHGKSVARG
jgi:hypothetical protein